jgi:putative oxidoreductase
MRVLRVLLAGLARLFLSAFFLASGINKIIYWKEAEKRLLNVLGDWQTYTVSTEGLQTLFSAAVVWAPLLLMAATFFEILGALLLLFGIREKLGALFLALILIPTTVLMHHFWFVEGSEREMQLSLFLRDIAILGGLLVVILHGAHGDGGGAKEDSFSKMS